MVPEFGNWASLLRVGVLVGVALLALWANTRSQGNRKDWCPAATAPSGAKRTNQALPNHLPWAS